MSHMDYYQQFSARDLCRMITDYWLSRGYRGIQCRVGNLPSSIAENRHQAHETIRSNIGPDGYPPKEFLS